MTVDPIERDETAPRRRVVGVVAWVLVVGLLVAGGAAALQSGDQPVTAPTPTPTLRGVDPASPTATPTTTPEPRPGRTRTLLTNPSLAATASRDDLHAALEDAATDGDWAFDEPGATTPASTRPTQRPIAIGQAEVGVDGTTDVDLVWSLPVGTDVREMVFRVLATADDLGADADVGVVLVDGEPVAAVVDPVTAQVTVPVDAAASADGEVRVRLVLSYVVPQRSSLPASEDPVGYGLLAQSGDLVALGHWLPVPTFDPGPFRDTGGDVGGFPAATWSVMVDHPGLLVTSGEEGSCFGAREVDRVAPDGTEIECTWARGFGLRDLSAVVVRSNTQDEAFAYVDRPEEGLSLGLVDLHASTDQAVVDEVVAAWDLLHDLLGPLAWAEIDVVAVPLRPAAAGMEFPGMVWVDPEVLAADGGFGSYVVLHEVAHQWFHALVGNGSLSDPVVDESVSQYLAYLLLAEIHGQAAADEAADRYLLGRAERAAADGVPVEPAAQAVTAFSSEAAYGAAVYGRAGHAWVEAEREVGRDRVVAALRTLVDEHRLDELTAVDMAQRLYELDAELATVALDPWGFP